MWKDLNLDAINLTELVELCRKAGLGNLPRVSREDLLSALLNDEIPKLCPLEHKRIRMQEHIKKNYRSLRTQLPGCNGKCTTFGCPDLVVQRCWASFKDDMV